MDTRESGDGRRVVDDQRADRGTGQVSQLGEGAGLDRATTPDDRDGVADLLHLAQDVRGEQHRPSRVLDPLYVLGEDRLHQGVQAGGRLVEDVELGVDEEGGHERHLLAVALRVRACLLGRVELEAVQQGGFALSALRPIGSVVQPGQVVDGLAAGEVGPQAHVTGNVGEPAVQGHGVAPGVATEEPGGTGVAALQAEQHPDRGRLPGAVGAEESGDLTGTDGQVQAVERFDGAERLAQVGDFDGVRCHCHSQGERRVPRW